MKLKRILTLALVALIGIVIGAAWTNVSYTVQGNNYTFRKRVGIKPTSNGYPDTNALLQIGDADSSKLGHIIFPNWTDTAKIRAGGHLKRGLMIFSSRDTCPWFYTGARWRQMCN